MAPLDNGLRVSNSVTNATSAVATITGVTGTYIYVTDISGSSDKAAALILVKDGSTVIWQDRISSGAPYEHSFVTPLRASIGATVTVTVDGTAIANANISGMQL